VEWDGYCRCRAIATLLGMSEYNWKDICMNLIGELHIFCDEHTKLYGSAMRVDELMHTLSCFECIAPHQYLMTLPDMGHLITSKYNVVLVHLSRMQYLTYLPLRSIPLSVIQHMIITISFVDDCHFVYVLLFNNLFIYLYNYVIISLLLTILCYHFVRCLLDQTHQFLPLHATGIDIDMILHVNEKHHI